ncbi:UDP-glycosyltransferase 76C2-like [Rutidosis leptorrhynchoides]|uniref:UDP-glycosyltransferase 76C2-like n=1 Tax=Rutidosis leptorrhynchoides TaxID=125765 RepID=UPI003A990BA4
MNSDGSLRSTQPPATRRSIILFPLPFQGHINPMLQLANILHTHGDFHIIIIHTQFNSPNPSKYPQFTFQSIKDGNTEYQYNITTLTDDPIYIFNYLNENCVDTFKDCVAGLIQQEPVACMITDAAFFFTQAVADELKLPRLVLRPSSVLCAVVYCNLTLFYEKGYFNCTNKDPFYDAPLPEYPIIKGKDISKISTKPLGHKDFANKMFEYMKQSSGIIWNTFKELEQPELETISHNFPIPHFTLGPFHKYFSGSSSSLIDEDRTIMSWLDTQPPKSTIYVSFGSVACITESEFQQVANVLENIGLPFLWVVRPGLVTGSKWLESLPETWLERVGEKGRIVKWCCQKEVLAHRATGCFWTHNGWNSTMESICEGVPMVCSPCSYDQPLNARYVSDVWKIGVLLEDGFEKEGIEKAIKKVMVDKEGDEIRERINALKEKLNLSLKEGGSSHKSLKNLVDYISSF